jgi:SprT protein
MCNFKHMNPRELQYNRNCDILRKYIPEAAVPLIAVWIIDLDFKLKIKKERSTRLGDYTSPRNGSNHLITINYNLNPYAFLITLVHEVAHLITFNQHKNRVLPHGTEWKKNFSELMQPFMNSQVFPVDVLYALRKYMQNPAASSCSDKTLLKTLKLYDEHDSGKIFLDYLPAQTVFLYNGQRLFKKGEKIRTRIRCTEVQTGHVYLFNALTEVEVFEPLNAQSDW